jgi:dihydroxy-acid dehydratase
MVAAADDRVTDGHLLELEKAVCPSCGSCSGMFTANSMNCLAEALGLALPGNGTVLATHANRTRLFIKAARLITEMAGRYYEEGDESVLPRSIATREAFINAMSLDIAMGGSTNTVLHLLAIAHAAGVAFNMKDIDMLSRKIPNICKVSPSSSYHIEDINRAGGVFAILGELERSDLLNTTVGRIDYPSLKQALDEWDIMRPTALPEAHEMFLSAPGRFRNIKSGSVNILYSSHDLDRTGGAIRDLSHPYNADGGLAVLYGNLAPLGCIVKTAGIDPSMFRFSGPAVVFNYQEEAVNGILNGEVKAGDVVVIRYEGPRGGPGMQEMLYPTSFLKSKGLDRKCALITDGRFSGGTAGLSIGHISPEAAARGPIALVHDGDIIEIDITGRTINLKTDKNSLARRLNDEMKKGDRAFIPERERIVPQSLKIYAAHVSSADSGAVREV